MKGKNNIAMRAIEVLKKEGMGALFQKALAYAKPAFLILPYALVNVKKANFANLDDLVDFCFHGIRGLIEPMQVRYEIMELLKVLSKAKPKVIVEIGTANG